MFVEATSVNWVSDGALSSRLLSSAGIIGRGQLTVLTRLLTPVSAGHRKGCAPT